jgi:hypothetical protein
VFDELKKISRAGDSPFKGSSIPVAVLLVLVVLLSAGSGLYAGTSFFAQQAPDVTITTTIFTTTTVWTTSTIRSIVTALVYGVWTTVEYTTSTSTIFATATTTTSSTLTFYTVTVNVKDSGGGALRGASVYLDGVLKGTTNSLGTLAITGVTLGPHTITVSKNYRSASQSINVTGDMSITITLELRW